MKQLLFAIYNFVLQLLNNENYIEVISMIVVAVTSYRIARYNASKPEKLKIKQLQFTNVYLPLFRVFSTLPHDITYNEATNFHADIYAILDKHYELVFPQLHELNQKLETDLLIKRNYQKTLLIMKHQVDVDYELLKKTLGYPSANFYDIFVRMTIHQKIMLIFSVLNFCAFLWLCLILLTAFSRPVNPNLLIISSVITILIKFLSKLIKRK